MSPYLDPEARKEAKRRHYQANKAAYRERCRSRRADPSKRAAEYEARRKTDRSCIACRETKSLADFPLARSGRPSARCWGCTEDQAVRLWEGRPVRKRKPSRNEVEVKAEAERFTALMKQQREAVLARLSATSGVQRRASDAA